MEGLRSYAFASVFVAHAADGNLADNELLVIRRNIHRAARSLGFRTQPVEHMLMETMDAYWQGLGKNGPDATFKAFQDAVVTVRHAFAGHPETLAAIQRDLLEIAHADNVLKDMEQVLIDHVAELWNEQHA